MSVVLITGVSGQDGSYLAERLLAQGVDVHAIVRDTDRPLGDRVSETVRLHTGDLAAPESIARVIEEIRPEVVFNLGGISSVALSWEQPDLTSRVTGHGVAVMLDCIWRLRERTGHDIRFVQASSSEIFGAASEQPQTEDTSIRPVSPYGAAKAYAHHLVGVYRGRDLFASSAILYNHESPRRPRTFVTRKITSAVAAIAAGGRDGLSLGNVKALRDWGWAPDYVDAMLTIAGADAPGDFIVSTGIAHSVEDFVARAFATVGISDWEEHVTIDERFTRPVEAPLMIGDHSRITSTLGWRPGTTFADLVRLMVEHDRKLLRP